MLEKVKEMKERFCRYFRIRKKLGGGYKKENKDYRLRKYGISIVKRKDECGRIEEGMIIEEEEMVLAPFGKDYKFHYEVVETNQDEYLLICTGNKVFKRWKDKPGVVEIEELENMHWEHSFGTLGMLFQNNRNSLSLALLEFNSGKIIYIDGFEIRPLYYYDYPGLDRGIELLGEEGWKYIYVKNDKIVISKTFEEKFLGYNYYDKEKHSVKIKPLRYQMNCVIGGKWKIYEVSEEAGIIESNEEWDEVKAVDCMPNTFLATMKGKDNGELLRLSTPKEPDRKPIIYPIPGTRFTSLGSVVNISYYEIGDKNGNLYLAKFDDNKEIKILAKYQGNALQISKSDDEDLEETIEDRLQVVKILVEPAEPVEVYNN